MQVKPWMKYTGIGIAGFVLGVIGAGSSETTTTTTTAPAKTVVNTKTVAPDADTLAALQDKVRTERDRLTTVRQKAKDEQARLEDLRGQVKTTKANTIPGEGTFVVGEDIQPGTYRAAAQQGCYWARLSSLKTSDIIDNNNSDGPVVVEILPTDKAFQVSGCANFQKVG